MELTLAAVSESPVSESKAQQVTSFAQQKYRAEPDWVTFYREVLGVGGIVDKLFPSFEDRCQFEQTPEFAEIQQMVARLRERKLSLAEAAEETRVITVRLPQSLHEALRHEAHKFKTSMNKLCISKLLQMIDDELVPSDFDKREPTPAAAPATVATSAVAATVPVSHHMPSHGVPATPIHALGQPGFLPHRQSQPQFTPRQPISTPNVGTPRAV